MSQIPSASIDDKTKSASIDDKTKSASIGERTKSAFNKNVGRLKGLQIWRIEVYK